MGKEKCFPMRTDRTGWSGGGAPRAGSLHDTKSNEAVVIAVAVIAVIIVRFFRLHSENCFLFQTHLSFQDNNS